MHLLYSSFLSWCKMVCECNSNMFIPIHIYIRSDYPMLLLTNGSIFTTLYLIFETLWIIIPCSYPISWMFSFFNSIVRLLVCGLSILSSKSKHGLKDLQHHLYWHHYIFLMAHVYDMKQFMTCENISKT